MRRWGVRDPVVFWPPKQLQISIFPSIGSLPFPLPSLSRAGLKVHRSSLTDNSTRCIGLWTSATTKKGRLSSRLPSHQHADLRHTFSGSLRYRGRSPCRILVARPKKELGQPAFRFRWDFVWILLAYIEICCSCLFHISLCRHVNNRVVI